MVQNATLLALMQRELTGIRPVLITFEKSVKQQYVEDWVWYGDVYEPSNHTRLEDSIAEFISMIRRILRAASLKKRVVIRWMAETPTTYIIAGIEAPWSLVYDSLEPNKIYATTYISEHYAEGRNLKKGAMILEGDATILSDIGRLCSIDISCGGPYPETSTDEDDIYYEQEAWAESDYADPSDSDDSWVEPS